MPADDAQLEVLVRVPNDLEAAMIVDLLNGHGIRAVAEGGFTAGFRAEAPGDVAIRVLAGDLSAARQILEDADNAAAGDASAG